MKTVRLALLGFGHVGRAFARLLISKQLELRQQRGLDWCVTGIFTRSHGAAIDPAGIDLGRAVDLVEAGQNLTSLTARPSPREGLDFVRACGAEALFENTPVNYWTGQPAVDHLRAALESGMHAITANKGPVVHAYHELTGLAQRHQRCFRFESAVMDGAPIFSLWRETLPAANLASFRGILNSTTNLILTRMEQGESFVEALAYAQSIGIAETDPSGDVLGWDSAVKVAALVTVLMDHPLKPDGVRRQGIDGIMLDDVLKARRSGKRWKLVCRAERKATGVEASVGPEQLDATDPLYHVSGTSSAVTFQCDVLSGLTIIENDPGPMTTAYGLLADLLKSIDV